jgi:predicted RNase H-like HicB family nuclease/predicted HTH domain antitoxin
MAKQVTKTYLIEVERDEAGYWIATAPEVSGMVTQSKRLDKVAVRAREAIAALLDKSKSSFEVKTHVSMLDDVPIEDAVTARKTAEATQIDATEKVRHVASLLVKEKALTLRDAGELLGISHQRVLQIVERTDEKAQRTEAAKRKPTKAAPKRAVRKPAKRKRVTSGSR